MTPSSSHSSARRPARSSDDYGHLANDSREHEVALLDALALERAVDAAWTSHPRHVKPLSVRTSRPRARWPRRVADARWTPRFVSVATPCYERSW